MWMVSSRRVECKEYSEFKYIEFVALLRRIVKRLESESHLYPYSDGITTR